LEADVRAGREQREIFINEILEAIPPIDVSGRIPSGNTEVRFSLCDFGSIAGNSDLFLVISPRPQPPADPPPNIEDCERDALAARDGAVRACEVGVGGFESCVRLPGRFGEEPADCATHGCPAVVPPELNRRCGCTIALTCCVNEAEAEYGRQLEFCATLPRRRS
jgi:hypothetical protein